MLSSKERIRKTEFPRDFRKGKTYHTPRTVLFIAPQNKQDATKYAFITPAKVSKKATERNLLRRRGYYAIQKIKTRIPKGYFCVFSFKKGCATLSYKEIEKEIHQLLASAHLLR